MEDSIQIELLGKRKTLSLCRIGGEFARFFKALVDALTLKRNLL